MSQTARESFPPVVYVPTEGSGPARERRVEMWRTPEGRVALFSYSAIDRLNDLYRSGSPWVLLDVAQLQRLHDLTPYDQLFIDCALEGDANDSPEAVW